MRPEPAAQYQPNPIAVRPPIGPAGSSSQLPLGAGLYAAHYQEPNLPAMNSAEPPAPQLETYYAPPPPLLSNHPFQSQAGLLPTPQLKTYYAPPPLFYSNPIQSQAGLIPSPQETYYARHHHLIPILLNIKLRIRKTHQPCIRKPQKAQKITE